MSDSGVRTGDDVGAAPAFLAGGGELGALMRAHDWSRTALGPSETWPQPLRTALRIMLTSRQPIWIGWGKELIYFYNDPYLSIIGGKHPWALGRPTSEVWREIWGAIEPMLTTAMGGIEGTYVEEQLLIMERNGYPEETYYTFSYSPIPGEDGAPGGIICANTEDTRRVVGERQLALLRNLAAETVDARSRSEVCRRSATALATDPRDVTFALIYIADPDGGTASLAAATGLAGGHAAAPVTLPLGDGAAWPLAAALENQEVVTVGDLAGRFGPDLPTGAWETPSSTAAILPIPASGETGLAGAMVVGLNPYRLFDEPYREFLALVARQIGAAIGNADAYEQERRRAEALSELDRAKTAFFSNVSHEFRTPLTLMLSPLEQILSGEVAEGDAREQVALAHRNGLRLLRLVNSLLDFSRIEAGRVQASFVPTELAGFTADIASSFRSAVERAGLRFTLDCAPLPQPVHVDREMWEKIVLNLLSNAFKFTHEGEIAVSVAAQDGGAVLRVRDSGIGISPEELPRLFERFHRIEGAQGRSHEGSGIGLALVHELVRLHGGEVSVESTPGRGTTFRLTLPFGTAHLPVDRVQAEAPPTASGSRAQAYVDEAMRWLPGIAPDDAMTDGGTAAIDAAAADPWHPDGRKRVVLADDNADMRDYVRRLLDQRGYEVEAVPDGEAALEAVRRKPADLLLTDVMMPRLDGFGLLRAVREDAATAGMPVIMLSARAGEEARVEGFDSGADDYLAKPFAARELIARVNANIRMAAIRREADRAVVQSEQRLMLTRDRLSLALSTGRVAVFEWDAESDKVAIQGPLAAAFGVAPEAAASGMASEAFFDGIEPGDLEGVTDAARAAIANGEPYEMEYRVLGTGEPMTILARGQVEATGDGGRRMTGVMIDVTEEKKAETLVRDNRAYLRELLDSTGEGFFAIDAQGITTLVNRAFLGMLRFASEDEAVGRPLHDVIHHTRPDGTRYSAADCPILRAARTGKPADVEGDLFYRPDGSRFPIEYRARPIRNDGTVSGAICTFADIGARLHAEEQLRRKQADLEEQTRALQIVNRAAAAVAGDLDMERLVQTITDACVELTGAQFGAFFYNVVDQAGEHYTLYTLSGAPREAFERFPMPRNTAVFGPTFTGTAVVRSDDITKDPRYGKSAPHHGMPEGHLPVRSYLAVPVRSRSGEVLGGLFFGHAEPGVFDIRSEERIVGIASQAAVAMDNARLFQEAGFELAERRRAEAELQTLNASLEERIARALAEQAKAEDALRQGQKMEAVGQLTGGVAHDFNNLLTVIIGGLETIRRSPSYEEARIKRAVDMAHLGAQRAAGLTGRLLAFSRQQALDPRPLDLNVLVRDMTELLHRTLGEHIELEGVLAPRLWPVEADQNQLEAALINLAVNARDAMPDGGKLTLETANTALDESYTATDAEVIPGQYVVICVSDSGTGMSPEVLSRVFEPFFTTKDAGRGTGLGLSMVYGFVKQSGGHVTIYSEEGEGTTVKLYFPRYLGGSEAEREPEPEQPPLGSQSETVLVVEDHEDVRTYSVMVLNELGYRVLEASDAVSGLAILRGSERIDLLFTDVVLPGMSGRQLADEALKLRPGLKVLFTTGYSRNAIVHHGRLDPGVQLISKPFTFEQLATRVRDVLDRG